ncbi:hypothetical protein DR864_21400 [Runella rosea]|uniref:Uncharacterized protein n=1 Tax=Runella rosea TaxID=2259595 RepID=A0A344TNA0_9BACT|nr:hypothetical protein DR864_21400 [Runella rosea]
MTTVSDNNKIEFYKFLNGDKSVEDLENFIYSQPDLEQQLGSETYFNLIELNFKDKYNIAKLPDLIKTRIIEEGQFETWKLKRILNDFLTQPEKTDLNLDKIYHLYCGVYQENGERRYEYKFLGNLGLNYLHWTGEGYLKTFYGDNWKAEYEKCSTEFEFYHKQLKNFATEILSAIDSKEIEILNDGTYRISNDLKNKLETDEIYKLIHPNEKYGS